MKKAKVSILVGLLSLFTSVSQAGADKLVEVVLASKMDEARGYCLDIAGGKGAKAPLDRGLQAHTCYNYTGTILEDQGFDAAQIGKGQFRIVYFDVCMAAASLKEGSALSLAKCDQADAQKFSLESNGRLIAKTSPELCVTINNTKKREGRGGTPVHVMRPLSLELCDDSKKEYQTWSLNEL